ncbi:MAG: hypothetical protein Q9217_000644 [Psora testacea]
MPHSPYRTTIYPPIQDLDEYRRDINKHRAQFENGEADRYAVEELLDLGEPLLEHCDFLETKLEIKKREYGQLAKQNETLKQQNEALKEESQAQKMEIAALKNELEKARAGTESKEQLSSNGDGTRIEANFQDVKSEIREAEKPEENEGSPKTTGMANSRKRGAEMDAATDGKTVKKRSTGNKNK